LKLVWIGCANHLRCALYVLVQVGILLVSTSLCAASKNNEEKLDQLRDRIEVIQKEILSKEAKKLEVVDTLQASERAISHANRRLAILSQKKRVFEVSIQQKRTQYGQIKAAIGELKIQLSKLLYHQYLESPPNYIRLLLNQQDPNQITRNLYYTARLSQARSDSIDALRNQLVDLRNLTQIISKKREAISAILAEQSTQKNWLEQEKIQRRKLLSRISEQIAQQQQDVSKLKRDEKRLSALTREINELVSDKNSSQSLYNNKLPDASIHGRLFASLKGHLNLPVRGELVSRFGSPRSGKNITWKGLFIRSPNGKAVKAIASGRIVFADWFRGFGNLMIIDHGNSYMSLYGNNEAIYKQVGEVIRSGDTIATVGSSGGNLDSGLYFELRYKGKPFDPLSWIKIE
jgi:murein hydrolase activator